MSPGTCTIARQALLDGDRHGAADHVAGCTACAAFARRLTSVDAMLGVDAETAAGAALPTALRTRIAAAVRRADRRTASPGARMIELAVRFAAVAAVLVAAFVALPSELRAGELDLSRLTEFESRVRAVVTEPPELAWPAMKSPLPGAPVESPWVLAGSATVLLAAGWLALRIGERAR